MRVLGIEPIYPKPRLSLPSTGHRKYLYLLRDLMIELSNQVWCKDITYISPVDSHVYLTAVMDWSSCVQGALQAEGIPEILNTDQGSQFTGEV